MLSATSSIYRRLASASRVRLGTPARVISAIEIAVLLAAGMLAAFALAWLPLQVRVPGHAILKATLPLMLGIAAVPRPWAGTIAGVGALGTSAVLLATSSGQVQPAALAGLLALGPCIDLVLAGTRTFTSWVYLRFAVAGLAANLVAFGVRWSQFASGIDAARPHRLQQFDLGVLLSFAICGLLAGGLSAVLLFRYRGRDGSELAS